MLQHEPQPGSPLEPIELLPEAAFAASDRRQWVGLEGLEEFTQATIINVAK